MTTLTFQNTTLITISRNNQTYITAADLATALQYADIRSITKIYTRNQDEFTRGMTEVVKLTTSEKSANLLTETRIFSLRGAHLIAMFARTPVAKDFRRWVLDILDKEVRTQTTLPAQAPIDNAITPEQQRAIQEAVNYAHHRTGLSFQEIYHNLKTMFKVAKYDQLVQQQFKPALIYINALTAPVEKIHLNSVDEEALSIMIKLYSFCFQAYEMQEKLQCTNIPQQMENEIGGQYLYSFRHPLKQAMGKAKEFIQSNTERLTLVKAMNNLLN